MTTKSALAAAVSVLVLAFAAPALARDLTAGTSAVTADGITRTVTCVDADWGSPNWRPVPFLAHNQVRSVDSLGGMARSVGAVAAINGGYFINAYSDDEPQGRVRR